MVRRRRPEAASKLKRASATATAAAEAAQRRAEALRERSITFDGCMRATELDKRRAGGLLAGGIAFRLFVWILPAALLVTGVLGLVRTITPEDPAKLARSSGLGGVVANAVGSASQQSSKATAALIAIGLVLTIYTGMSCVRALRLAHLLAWSLPLTRRKGLVKDGVYFSVGADRAALAGRRVAPGCAATAPPGDSSPGWSSRSSAR